MENQWIIDKDGKTMTDDDSGSWLSAFDEDMEGLSVVGHASASTKSYQLLDGCPLPPEGRSSTEETSKATMATMQLRTCAVHWVSRPAGDMNPAGDDPRKCVCVQRFPCLVLTSEDPVPLLLMRGGRGGNEVNKRRKRHEQAEQDRETAPVIPPRRQD